METKTKHTLFQHGIFIGVIVSVILITIYILSQLPLQIKEVDLSSVEYTDGFRLSWFLPIVVIVVSLTILLIITLNIKPREKNKNGSMEK